MISPRLQAVAGAVGSSVSSLLVYPLDVVIVRAQIKKGSLDSPLRERLVSLVRRIYATEGLHAFFSGSLSDFAATLVQTYIYFYVYHALKVRALRRNALRRAGVVRELACGTIAGAVCKLFSAPLKNIVLQKQLPPTATPAALPNASAASGQHRSTTECIKRILKERGITGFWAGYRATLVLSLNPTLAYYFFQLLGSGRPRQRFAAVFVRAAVAKSLAMLLTYPLILAKTRTQAAKARGIALITLITEIVKREGFASLFKGAEAQLLKNILTQGLGMAIKEWMENMVLLVRAK